MPLYITWPKMWNFAKCVDIALAFDSHKNMTLLTFLLGKGYAGASKLLVKIILTTIILDSAQRL